MGRRHGRDLDVEQALLADVVPRPPGREPVERTERNTGFRVRRSFTFTVFDHERRLDLVHVALGVVFGLARALLALVRRTRRHLLRKLLEGDCAPLALGIDVSESRRAGDRGLRALEREGRALARRRQRPQAVEGWRLGQ